MDEMTKLALSAKDNERQFERLVAENKSWILKIASDTVNS